MNGVRLFLVVSAMTAQSLLNPPLVDDDPPVKEHGYDVAKLCKEAESQYKNKSHRDVGRIQDIFQTFSDITPAATDKEKKKMARTLRKAFDVKPFPEDASFLYAAAACLSDLGKPGLDALLYAVKHKNLKVRVGGMENITNTKRRRVRETVIEAIGFNKNPLALKTLYDLLHERDGGVLRSTCRALGCFGELPLERRKPIVERLLDAYTQLEKEADDKGDGSEAYDRLLTVEVAFNDALQKMTYRNFDTASEWREWYKEYKDKKEW